MIISRGSKYKKEHIIKASQHDKVFSVKHAQYNRYTEGAVVNEIIKINITPIA